MLAPHSVELGGASVSFAAFFPNFGGRSGMVTDPDWSVIAPHKEKLRHAGFGYSCVEFVGSDHQSMCVVLADWGWTGAFEDKPDWA